MRFTVPLIFILGPGLGLVTDALATNALPVRPGAPQGGARVEACLPGQPGTYLDRLLESSKARPKPCLACAQRSPFDFTVSFQTFFHKLSKKVLPDETRPFPKSCVLASMNDAWEPGSGPHYGYCSSPRAKTQEWVRCGRDPKGVSEDIHPPKTKLKPKLVQTGLKSSAKFVAPSHGLCRVPAGCVSQKYLDFVYDSFTETMSCLRINPRELFRMIHQESRFQLNAVSGSGVAGIAQMSGDGIAPGCESVAPDLAEKLPSLPRCERIAGPPRRSFAYMGLFYLDMKKRAIDAMAKFPKMLKVPAADKVQIARDLVFYMYNGGPAGIEVAFRSFVAEFGGRVTYSQFSRYFHRWLANQYGKELEEFEDKPEKLKARRREVSGYLSQMTENVQAVSVKAGVSCGY
jgi:hypothetical protein